MKIVHSALVKIQKTLILVFETNSVLAYQNGLFFRVLAHCVLDGSPKNVEPVHENLF